MGAPRELIARLALEGALNQRLRRRVVHVRELDRLDAAGGLLGIDQGVLVASSEALPLEVGRNTLGRAEHVAIEGANLLGLAAGEGVESLHSLLDNANDMGLKYLK